MVASFVKIEISKFGIQLVNFYEILKLIFPIVRNYQSG